MSRSVDNDGACGALCPLPGATPRLSMETFMDPPWQQVGRSCYHPPLTAKDAGKSGAVTCCHGLNGAPPRKMCPRPNPQSLGVGPRLGKASRDEIILDDPCGPRIWPSRRQPPPTVTGRASQAGGWGASGRKRGPGGPDGAWAWARGGGSQEAGALCGSLGGRLRFLWLVPSWKQGQNSGPL